MAETVDETCRERHPRCGLCLCRLAKGHEGPHGQWLHDDNAQRIADLEQAQTIRAKSIRALEADNTALREQLNTALREQLAAAERERCTHPGYLSLLERAEQAEQEAQELRALVGRLAKRLTALVALAKAGEIVSREGCGFPQGAFDGAEEAARAGEAAARPGKDDRPHGD